MRVYFFFVGLHTYRLSSLLPFAVIVAKYRISEMAALRYGCKTACVETVSVCLRVCFHQRHLHPRACR